MVSKYRLDKLRFAICLGLAASASVVQAAEEQEIEEVVAVGSRLQGSAAAVIEERKNQAFVADILGAEQLSRTGDSDAASALKRVTGLTLVDGKFIYVRGLGERYSSARLNGAYIPSPDLTRNVVPLDIFPASIIESMAVQKAYSPNMPAAFGGGNIDIRTKSVPAEFIAGLELSAGKNSESSDGFSYQHAKDALPTVLSDAIVKYRGDFSLSNIIKREGLVDSDAGSRSEQAIQINQQLLKALPREFGVKSESLSPNVGAKFFIGNSFSEDFLGGEIGFLFSAAMDRENQFQHRETGVIAQGEEKGCATTLNTPEEVGASCFNTFKSSDVTTENERYNGTFNLGYKVDGHKLSAMKLYLVDEETESELSTLQSPAGSTVFTIVNEGRANRTHRFDYEKRKLDVNQFVGQHTFLDYWGIGFDWQYSESEASTEIPASVKYNFRDNYEAGVYKNSQITGDDNRVMYAYTDMEDHVKSSTGNMSLPLSFDGVELELRGGYDFSDRARVYTTSAFAVNNGTGLALEVANDELQTSAYLTDSFLAGQRILLSFNEPTAPDADDYIAAQKIDAGYVQFDALFDNVFRVSGGLRYEEFKQTSVGTSSLIFTREDLEIFYSEEKVKGGSISEDDIYPALSVTYLPSAQHQIRLGYGETVVRPDLREVVPVAYFDPLTDIRTFGSVGLKSSPIKNYDLRYEFYGETGNSVSVGAFYKDIQSPIETVLRIGDEDYSASFVNGETATVYGVEAEWLQDLDWLASGFFTSGNITVSDSEASIDPAFAGNLTNPTKRMTGHSKYVVNLQMNYDSADGQHSGSLVYNVFGERILAAGLSGTQDAYEQPFHSLDLVYTWYPDFNSKVKFKIKNLLNESQEVTQSEVVVRSKDVGINFGISYNYEF